jgi:hypothetical protein
VEGMIRGNHTCVLVCISSTWTRASSSA